MTLRLAWTLLRWGDPPLTPSAADARSDLRRELLHPEYHRDNLVLRLLDWIGRLLDRGLAAARDAPPLSTFAAMLVGLLLLGAVGWLVSRTRRSSRAPGDDRAVHTDETVTAAELRLRAERALAEGRYTDAVVDAFRATARHQVERGRVDDVPGATAHEVALSLAEAFPDRAGDLHRCGAVFDEVLYGGRTATRDQAVEMLGLDERLAVRR